MKFVDNVRQTFNPVESGVFSTGWTHRATRLTEPKQAVFPVIHTPYVLLREV